MKPEEEKKKKLSPIAAKRKTIKDKVDKLSHEQLVILDNYISHLRKKQ